MALTAVSGDRIELDSVPINAVKSAERPYTIAEANSLFNTKAATGHSHAIVEVSGLPGALDGKAAAAHTHPQSEVTNLVADLAAKIGFTTSADANLTNYPIGQILLVSTGGDIARNASATLSLADTHAFTNGSGGAVLSGTWRAKGDVVNNVCLFQRVA